MKKNIYNFLSIIILFGFSIFLIGNFSEDKYEENINVNSIFPSYNLPIKPIYEVIAEKKGLYNFSKISLFEFGSENIKSLNIDKYVKKATFLKLKNDNLNKLYSANLENIILEIPISSSRKIELQLTKADIFTNDFKIEAITENGIKVLNYKQGIYYRGIVKDDIKSSASISIFEDGIIGIISDENGNYNIGQISNELIQKDYSYVFYNDRDLLTSNPFYCGVDDYGNKLLKYYPKTTNQQNKLSMLGRSPVRVFFETDYQVFLDYNMDTNAIVNYVTGFFNSVATIYQNEYLPVQISTLRMYTTPDPYRFISDPILILLRFGAAKKNTFNGDLAHLLSTRTDMTTSLAWVKALCSNYNPADSSGPYAFSGIEKTYQPFPTYSWTVGVVAHEMGHNFGSLHTHACVWPIAPNRIGALDSCYYPEGGNCFSQLTPQISTIMSYCHLQSNYGGGVILNFGPLPGDTIRLGYNRASCFGPVVNSSEAPVSFTLLQNYPNPFNPLTNIRFDVPQEAFITIKIFDITGKEIVTLLNNQFHTQGYYSIKFNSDAFKLSTGVYFYKIFAFDAQRTKLLFTDVKRMILLK